jgi:hypothetical protein
MKCHLCEKEIIKPYWIMDMKFCQSCFEGINRGSISLLQRSLIRPIDIQMHNVILNGEPTQDTYREYRDKGYIILYTDKAKRFHPYACDTDTIMFMAKPIDKEKYDEYMENWRKDEIPESVRE